MHTLLAAITGRTTWARTAKVPSMIRRQLCADLGWPCLWTTCRVSAVTLFMKLAQDDPIFAHTRLCSDRLSAPGGWVAACKRLVALHQVPTWEPDPSATIATKKSSLHRFRRQFIEPAITASSHTYAVNPPLPWAWIASFAQCGMRRSAFELWWQLRILGKPYPLQTCPWCDSKPGLVAQHLQTECDFFAVRCWTHGVQPEEILLYPTDAKWFEAALSAFVDLVKALQQHPTMKRSCPEEPAPHQTKRRRCDV